MNRNEGRMTVMTFLAPIRFLFLAMILALATSASAAAQKLGPDGAPNPTASVTSVTGIPIRE